MINLSEDAKKHPIENIILALLLFFAMVFFPSTTILKLIFGEGDYPFSAVYSGRLIFSAVFIVLAICFGYKKIFYRFSFKGIINCLPALFIAVSIFPFYSVFTGGISINSNSFLKVFEYILAVFSIALAEELVFRGIIFPLCFNIFKDKKASVILAVLLSSVIFALSHFVNLISSNIGTVAVQSLYCLFTGAVFTVSFILSKNIFVPIFLHFILDIGGLLTQKTYQIAVGGLGFYDYLIAVIVGIVCGSYLLYKLLKTKNEDIISIYN